MSAGLNPIKIKELIRLKGSKSWMINGYISGVNSLTPVRGLLTAFYKKDFIFIDGEIETILNLYCDRCLKNYNKEINFSYQDKIYVEDSSNMDIKKSIESSNEFYDQIKYIDSFNPEKWLFEEINLRIPQIKICDDNCPGHDSLLSKEYLEDQTLPFDPRLSKLKKLLEL